MTVWRHSEGETMKMVFNIVISANTMALVPATTPHRFTKAYRR
ncbi:hypothetical protein [Fervidibacter sacchari]